MKQNLKKGKVQGSVLFTVVAVMLVMVVFLMSTLILTNSANRRSYYTYFESQSQYAAQAALSAVTNSAYTDADFHEWVVNSATDGADPLPITVDFTGSHIQFTNGNDSVTCTVEKVPSNYVWDDATQAVHEQKSWKITATASVGNGRNASEYTVCNYIYENFHIDDPELLNSVMNEANNKLHDYTLTPGASTVGGSLLQALASMSGTSLGQNMSMLGPQYAGMTKIPIGRINYDTVGYVKETTSNNNMAVGNIIYVDSLYSEVERIDEFQSFGESAIYYGNIVASNNGFAWYTNMSAQEVSRYGTIAYNNLPYVYVDGTIDGNAAPRGDYMVGYTPSGITGNYPVNLFTGAVNCPRSNSILCVHGDAYLYDPALDSYWSGNDTAINNWGGAVLKYFVYNNITQSNTQYSQAATGGNIFCNNASLTLGIEKNMTIEGDLIFSNPQGFLNFTNKVTVNGRVICAGTITGIGNLTCNNIITPNSYSMCADGVETPLTPPNDFTTQQYFESFYDSNYSSNCINYGDYTQRANNQLLFPFNYRLDEIHETYYRWDLKSGDANQAAQNAANDPLVQESIATGHAWQDSTGAYNVRQFEIKNTTSEPVYSYLFPGDPGFQWGDSRIYYDQKLGSNVIRILQGYNSTTTTETWYVPYTAPRNPNNAIVPKYEPISPDSAAATMAGGSAYAIETVADFATYMTAPQTYDNNNPPTYVNSVPIVYHDASGARGTTNLDAYVVNKDCYINLNSFSGKTILIDPGSHTDTNPLCIVFQGTSMQNAATVIVNNTASYSTDYKTANAYCDEATPVYAGRREVYIMWENGFGCSSQPFKLVCSGAYGQMINSNFNVVSNPIYPGDSRFNPSVLGSLTYSYELIPNVVIFGENGATYRFEGGTFINAEIIMPKCIFNTKTSGYQASCDYREQFDSGVYPHPTYTQKGAMTCLGTMLVWDLDSETNPAVSVYLGDSNRNPSTPGYVDNSRTNSHNSSKLGQDYNDYFSNDHQGAS